VQLVTIRHDEMLRAWKVKCSICGSLGDYRNFWVADRTRKQHEADAH